MRFKCPFVLFKKTGKEQSDQLSVNYIESSNNYDYMKGRVEYLPSLEYIFDSNDTIFKYNPALQAFSVIEADFLFYLKGKMKSIFVRHSSLWIKRIIQSIRQDGLYYLKKIVKS